MRARARARACVPVHARVRAEGFGDLSGGHICVASKAFSLGTCLGWLRGGVCNGDRNTPSGVAVTCTAGPQDLGPPGEQSGPALKATDFPNRLLYLVTSISRGRADARLG